MQPVADWTVLSWPANAGIATASSRPITARIAPDTSVLVFMSGSFRLTAEVAPSAVAALVRCELPGLHDPLERDRRPPAGLADGSRRRAVVEPEAGLVLRDED